MKLPVNRGRIALALMTALATATTIASIARANTLNSQPLTANQTVCMNSPIPPGYVIVGQTTNFSCSPSINNAWIIKQPGPTETVCMGSPIPGGYAIIGQTTNFSCSSSLNNAHIIKKL